MNDILYLVVPCYNEEPVLPETVRELTKKLNSIIQSGLVSPESRMVFVNHGSKDST